MYELLGYRPRAYPGRITLFRSRFQSPFLGLGSMLGRARLRAERATAGLSLSRRVAAASPAGASASAPWASRKAPQSRWASKPCGSRLLRDRAAPARRSRARSQDGCYWAFRFTLFGSSEDDPGPCAPPPPVGWTRRSALPSTRTQPANVPSGGLDVLEARHRTHKARIDGLGDLVEVDVDTKGCSRGLEGEPGLADPKRERETHVGHAAEQRVVGVSVEAAHGVLVLLEVLEGGRLLAQRGVRALGPGLANLGSVAGDASRVRAARSC
jgi:hypothetical protein